METSLCPKCQQTLRTGTDGSRRLLVCPPCGVIIEDNGQLITITTRTIDTSLVELFEEKLAEYAPDLRVVASKSVGGEAKVVPGRRMRWDYVVLHALYPEVRVAIEVDGLCHRTRERFQSDILKSNVAMVEGWRWLRCSRQLLTDDRRCREFFQQLLSLTEGKGK